MRIMRYLMLSAGLTAVIVSVSYFASLFAQQDVPDEPRPAAVAAEQLPPVPEGSVEVQTSGPLHEAFATPLTTEVPESIVVDRQPPQAIEEVPPDQRPEGSNVVWVPGYFAWDDERDDFIWISGFWRDVPPGRAWVSGYWTEAERGWQWVPGFWTAAEQREVEYLPQPPEIVEEGPSIAQPSQNHFWVPGHWEWRIDHYVWRPGYWSRINPEWVWVPSHYVWCPSGYVFVNGYWDYPIVRRGLLFAPVYFEPVVYRRHYHYTPSFVWSTALLTTHLWVRPSYYHYYYGDYYHDRYRDFGIRPWYLSFAFGRTSYDPLFSYYRWHHRDRDWDRHVRDRHDYYRRNQDFRPPRTYRDQQRLVERGGDRDRLRDVVVAAPITQVVNNTTAVNANFRTSFRFDRVAQPERRQIARQADELRNVTRQRRALETRENVARIEDQDRKGVAKGEDARVRRAAPRKLDISKAVQAIGVTPDEGTRRLTDRAIDRQTGRRRDVFPDRGEEGLDRKGIDAGRPSPEIGAPDRRRPDIGLPGRVGRGIQGPDVAGPDIGRPDRVRPEITRPDRAPDAKRADRSPEVKEPARGPDAKAPGRRSPTEGLRLPSDTQRERRPDPARTLRDLGSPPPTLDRPRIEAPGRDRAPPSNRGPVERGSGQRNRGERRTTPGRAPDTSQLDRGGVPFSPRITGSPSGPSGTPTGAGVSPLAGEARRALDREEARRAARGMIESRRSEAVRRTPDVTRGRTDPVTPLRVGAPTPAARAMPAPRSEVRASRPELPRSITRGAERPSPAAERATAAPSRGPGAESRGRERAEERKSRRERD